MRIGSLNSALRSGSGQLGPAHAGAGRVAALRHKAGNDAVEHDAVVESQRWPAAVICVRHGLGARSARRRMTTSPVPLPVSRVSVRVWSCHYRFLDCGAIARSLSRRTRGRGKPKIGRPRRAVIAILRPRLGRLGRTGAQTLGSERRANGQSHDMHRSSRTRATSRPQPIWTRTTACVLAMSARRDCRYADAGDDETCAQNCVAPSPSLPTSPTCIELTPVGSAARLAGSGAWAKIVSADVLAELNDYVRDALIDAVGAGTSSLNSPPNSTPTMPSPSLRILATPTISRPCSTRWSRRTAPQSKDALSYPRGIRRAIDAARPDRGARTCTASVEVIDLLRDSGDLTTDFWEVYRRRRACISPVGTCQLSWVLHTAARSVAVADLMKREQTPDPGRRWTRRKSRCGFRNTR